MSGSFDVKCEWFGSVLLTRTRRRSGWLEYGATVPAPRRQRNSSGVRRPGYSAGYRRTGGDRGRARRAPSGPRYLAELHEQGRAPSSASTAVAAARFRARLAGEQSPAGERTARVLAGYRRTAVGRGRG